MMHHHIKYGYKRFNCPENIVQTLTEIFNLRGDLDFKNNNPVFSPGL